MIVHTGESTPTRPVYEVLGIPPGGPSSRGSTWWRRYLACPREHALVNILGWRAEGLSKALDYGLVWHWLLEIFYKQLQAEQGGQTFADAADTAVFKALAPLGREPGYEEAFSKFSTMLDVYLRRWDAHDRKHFEILGVETELENNSAGFPYSVRLDLLVKDHSVRGGVVKGIEHKSSASLDPNTVSGYNQDLQVLGQVWLVGVEVDLDYYGPFLGVQVSITTKAKTPQTLRVPVQPGPASLEAWKQSMLFWWGQEQAYEQAGYPQNFNACMRRFSRCDMWEVCYRNPGQSVVQLKRSGPPVGFKVGP